MATGMNNTGMRGATGSRAMTAGRGAPGKPGGGPLGKFREIWAGLGKVAKIGICCVVGLALTGAITMSMVSSANKPVDLYTTKMTQNDVKDCAAKLTELGIEHQVNVTGEGILINPKLRGKAQAMLAANGLPRHPIQTPDNTPADGINAKTQAEARAQRQRLLEGQVTEALRQFEGVADAYVKIAAPEESFFRDDAKPTTATVMLKLTPGTRLNEQQVNAVVHHVSYSIPELDRKNVKVIDTQMNDLTAMIEHSEDGSVPAGKQSQMEGDKARELQKKAQAQLDQVLGPGRSSVQVSCEYDFKQVEKKHHGVGGAGDNGQVVTGSQTKREVYNKNGQPGGESAATPLEGEGVDQAGLPGGKKDGNNYVQEIESKKVDYDRTDITEVRKTPEIKRISASLALDNLKDDQAQKIVGMVKGTLGINEERGDMLQVASLPFARQTLGTIQANQMLEAMNSQQTETAAAGGQISPQVVGLALFGPAVLLLGLIGVFLLKQHRVQVNKSQLMLDTTSGGTTSTDIADLLTDKSGRTTSTQETKVNTSDALEKLAKEKPTKVAEMLKSTWLSG